MDELTQRPRSGKQETAAIAIPAGVTTVTARFKMLDADRADSANSLEAHVWIGSGAGRRYYGGFSWRGHAGPWLKPNGEVSAGPSILVGPLREFAGKTTLYIETNSNRQLRYGLDVEFGTRRVFEPTPDAHHSIAFVGSSGIAQADDATSVTTPSRTTSAGNSYILCAGRYSPSVSNYSTPTDSQSNTWAIADQHNDGSEVGHTVVAYAHDITGGASHTVTTTFVSGSYCRAVAFEYSGMADAAPEATNHGNDSDASVESGSVSASSGSYCVAVMTVMGFPVGALAVTSSGWTQRAEDEDSEDNVPINAADYESSGASEQATWSIASGQDQWIASIAAFTAAGGGTAEGAVSIAGTGAVSAAGASQAASAATMAGTGAVSASGAAQASAAASVAGTGAVSAAGASEFRAAVSIAASSAVSAAGAAGSGATLSVAATSAVSAAGASQASSALSVAGTAAVSPAGASTHSAAVTIAGTSAVSAVGDSTTSGTGAVTIAGASTVSPAGASLFSAGLTIAATSTVAAQSGSRLTISATSTVSAVGDSTATGSGILSVSGVSSVSAAGASEARSAASIAGTATVSPAGASQAQAAITIAATSTVSAVSAGTGSGAVTIAGAATVSPIGAAQVRAVCSISASSAVATVGASQMRATVGIAAASTMLLTAAPTVSADLSIAATSTVSTFSSGAATTALTIAGVGAFNALTLQNSLKRVFTPPARAPFTVEADTRTFNVPSV